MKELLELCLLVLFVIIKEIGSDSLHLNLPTTVYYSYTTITNQITPRSSTFQTIDMKTHIKTVLKMSIDNKTLDDYIQNYFRIDNPNPAYIFIIPDDKNRTLILRRNDFLEANFPKITTINKFKEPNFFNENLKPEKLTNNKYSDYLEKFKQRYDHVLDERNEIENNIVLENVRTERNFIKMMEELNENPETFTKNPQDHVLLESRRVETVVKRPDRYRIDDEEQQTVNGYRKKDDNFNWDDLGLKGWSGGLREGKDEYVKDGYVGERPPPSEFFLPNANINQNKKYFHSSNFKTKPLKPPKIYSYSNRNTMTTPISNDQLRFKKPINNIHFFRPINTDYSVTEDINDYGSVNREEISEQLSQLLAEERQKYSNNSGNYLEFPKFPVTSSRDSHRNEDVFIARANNPFGHSTKWSLSESSGSSQYTPIPNSESDERKKRGVVQLYSMIKCSTGCDPLIYKGYGCYCGFLGSGKVLDGIDRCCAMHDFCYSVSACPMFLEYFVPYLWKCYKGRPLCAIDHGEWGGPGSCAARLCECDRVLTKCLRQYHCPHKRAVCPSSSLRMFQNLLMEFGS